jgi:hypothetical protein
MQSSAQRASLAMDRLKGGLQFAAGFAGTLGGAFSVASGLASKMALETAATVASLDDLSKASGVSAQAIESLRMAGGLLGADQEALDKGVKNLALRMDNLRDSSDGAYKGLAAINPALAKQVAKSKDANDALELISGAMMDMTHEQRLATGEIVFGAKSADDFALALSLTRDEYTKLTDRMQKFKPTLDIAGIEKLAALDDTLEETKLAVKGTQEAFAVGLAPGLQAALERLNGWLLNNRERVAEWGENLGRWIESINWDKVAEMIGHVGTAAQGVATAVGVMADAFHKLSENVGGADNAIYGLMGTYAAFKAAGVAKGAVRLAGRAAAAASAGGAAASAGGASLAAGARVAGPAVLRAAKLATPLGAFVAGLGIKPMGDGTMPAGQSPKLYDEQSQKLDAIKAFYQKQHKYDGLIFDNSGDNRMQRGSFGRDMAPPIDTSALGRDVGTSVAAAIAEKLKGSIEVSVKVTGEGVSVAGTGITKTGAVVGNVGATGLRSSGRGPM